MNKILHSRSFHIVIALTFIAIAIFSLIRVFGDEEIKLVTAEVSLGSVENVVSVSGVVEADNSADLAFPVVGKVAEILVAEGDMVAAGDVLLSLKNNALLAEKQNAYASLLIAQANRDELINGPSGSERVVTNTNVRIAEENLVRVIAEEDEKIKNAKRTLLSSSLEALPTKNNNDDPAPTISGTYTCDAGTHIMSLYSSGATSGYSYQLSGIDTGTYTARTDAPAAFGVCGLSAQFTAGEIYSTQDWIIEVPNTRSSLYATNLNAYNLALQLQQNNAEAARQNLELEIDKQTQENTYPREEAVQRANANILRAEAELAIINSKIQDHTIVAPFDGSVTSIDVLAGETVTTEPVVTVLSEGMFEVTARIPEIDITKITLGQSANIVFDARVTETLPAKIVFISPLATEIDGVAYFEATIHITDTPAWVRGGLNADIDIIVEKTESTLRIPKRFLITTENETSVLTLQGEDITQKSIQTGLVGNDGFVEIIGLNEGDLVVAP